MIFSHEVPKALLKESRFFNDLDYALDIHFDDEEYYDFFKKSIELGRTVILDNSLYERRITGIPFDEKAYIKYIKDIKPTYYIVPDAYESAKDNIDLFNSWMKNHNLELISNKKIVVVHGKDYQDYVRCYKYFDDHIKDNDWISFSGGDSNIDRESVIKRMYLDGHINLKRKHHLLGLVHPKELESYRYLSFINSIDTSLPVVCTVENNKIDEIREKPKTVITKIFDDDIKIDFSLLYYNVYKLRRVND